MALVWPSLIPQKLVDCPNIVFNCSISTARHSDKFIPNIKSETAKSTPTIMFATVSLQCSYDWIYCYNNVQNLQFLIHFNIKGNANWQIGFYIQETGEKGEKVQYFEKLLNLFTELFHNHCPILPVYKRRRAKISWPISHIHEKVPNNLTNSIFIKGEVSKSLYLCYMHAKRSTTII